MFYFSPFHTHIDYLLTNHFMTLCFLVMLVSDQWLCSHDYQNLKTSKGYIYMMWLLFTVLKAFIPDRSWTYLDPFQASRWHFLELFRPKVLFSFNCDGVCLWVMSGFFMKHSLAIIFHHISCCHDSFDLLSTQSHWFFEKFGMQLNFPLFFWQNLYS